LIPDSERAYYNNIIESYRRLVAQLDKTNGVYTANRIRIMQELLKDELNKMSKEFDSSFSSELPDITSADIDAYQFDKEVILAAGAVSYPSLSAVNKTAIKELIKDEGFLYSYIKADGTIVRRKYTSRDIVRGVPDSIYTKVNQIFLAGATVGDSPDKIARDLKPFYVTEQKRQVRTMVRSLIGEASAKSHKAWDDNNEDIIGKWVFDATLDSRTSSICRSLDKRTWNKKPAPQYWPKLHPNCRSIMVSIPIGYDQEGTRPVNLMTAQNKKHAKTLKGKEREDYMSQFVHQVPIDMSFKQATELFPQLKTEKFIDTEEYFNKLGV